MRDNLNGALDQLSGAVESVEIAVGSRFTPVLQTVSNALADLVSAFTSLPGPVQSFIAYGAAAAAVLLLLAGPMLMLIGFLPQIAAGFGLISGAMAGFSATALPILGIIAGIAAAAGLLYLAWQNNFGGIRDITMQLWSQIEAKFQEVYNYVAPIVTSLIAYITQQWPKLRTELEPVMQWLGVIFKYVFKFAADTVMFYINSIVLVIKGAINVISGIIKFFVALFTGDWKGMWDAVKQIFTGAVQLLHGLFNLWFVGRIAGLLGSFASKGLSILGGFASKDLGSLGKFASSALGSVGRFVSGSVSRIGNFATSALNAIVRFVSGAISRIASWASSMVCRAGSGMSRFVRGIANGASRAISYVRDMASRIVNAFTSLPGRMASIGRNIVYGIWNGIHGLGGWLAGKLISWAKAIIPGPIAKVLGINSPSRLMAEYGGYVVQGLAKGMLRAEDLVKSASEQIANTITFSAPSPALAAVSGRQFGAQQITNSNMNQYNAPLICTVVVRNDSDLRSIQNTMRQLYEENAKVQRAMGKGR